MTARDAGATARAATAADVDAVVALVQSAYRGEASRAGWTTEADWIDGARTDAREVGGIIAAPDSLILVLDALSGPDEAPVLLASCQLARRSAGVAYFGMFAVRPGAQGRGTGRTLLAAAEAWARDEWGAHTMTMTVIDVRHELIAWYERQGYRRTGETEPFPYGQPAFGIPKVPGLRFAVLAKELAADSPPGTRGARP
jgi:GNAT superfamily N-acetyltransferase